MLFIRFSSDEHRNARIRFRMVANTSSPLALIFDMDGVLINSEPVHERSKREALAQSGIHVPNERFANYIGRSDTVMIQDLAAEHGLTEADGTEILRLKHSIYESLEDTMQPVDGAVAFLHWAANRFRLALATSSNQRNRRATLDKLGVATLFEAAVDAARFTHPKPSPEVFLIALNDLRLDPADCWIIEDALNGILAAKAAGCFAVGITTSFSREALKAAGADLVIDAFAELEQALQPSSDTYFDLLTLSATPAGGVPVAG